MSANLILGAVVALFIVVCIVTATLEALMAQDEKNRDAEKAAKRTSRESHEEEVDRPQRSARRPARVDGPMGSEATQSTNGARLAPAVQARRSRDEPPPAFFEQMPADFNLADIRDDHGRANAEMA